MSNLSPTPLFEPESIPFASGEEAWFWFSCCQIMRIEGTPSGSERTQSSRPCSPDDIYRIVMTLHRKRRIESYHLQVMGKYGQKLVPPNPYCSEEATDARLWNEALDYLEEELLLKGIME